MGYLDTLILIHFYLLVALTACTVPFPKVCPTYYINGKLLSPVYRVPVLCPCIEYLLSILHPEAFPVGSLSSGEVTLQGDWFVRAVR